MTFARERKKKREGKVKENNIRSWKKKRERRKIKCI